MPKTHDRVKDTTASTGTGAITLSGTAPTGFRAFAAAYAVGQFFPYCIAGGSEWETGIGYLSTSTTLVRSAIKESSNSNLVVNFSAGTKDVFVTATADVINNKGQMLALARGLDMP